jgi:hypothetical protein
VAIDHSASLLVVASGVVTGTQAFLLIGALVLLPVI